MRTCGVGALQPLLIWLQQICRFRLKGPICHRKLLSVTLMVLYAQQIATSSGSILPRAIAHPNLFALASLYYSLLDSWHVYCAGWSWIPTKNSFAKSFSKMASLEENLMYIPFALMGINFILSGLFVNFIQLILWLTVKPWNIKLYHQCMYYCVYAVWGRKWILIFINLHVYMFLYFYYALSMLNS